jgi:hypothetical protein
VRGKTEKVKNASRFLGSQAGIKVADGVEYVEDLHAVR